MLAIIKEESRRIFTVKVLIIFAAVIIFFSASSSHNAVKNYDIHNASGIAVAWSDNLAHGKASTKGKHLNSGYLTNLKNHQEIYSYLDKTNVENLVIMNFEKKIGDLTEEEIKEFYRKRLENIRKMLTDNPRLNYSEKEISGMIKRAELLTNLPMGYCEGWKVLNGDIGRFQPVVLIITAIILLQLFGREPQTKMKELYQSTRYGKKHLVRARIILAYLAGVILYLVGNLIYVVIKMIPFGWEGAGEPIQNNASTFFSLYNISYLQQFLINLLIGFLAMLFIISFILLVTVITEGIMTGAVILIFFWIFLLLLEQVPLYPVYHYFSNFMPLRMTNFLHYYTGYERYQISGNNIPSMNWVVVVAILLSAATFVIALIVTNIKQKHLRGRAILLIMEGFYRGNNPLPF